MKISAKHRFALIFLIFGAALILRSLAGGLTYYPIVDDSIQYINFQKSNDFSALIKTEGLFASRPLAVLVDLFVVGPFNDFLIIPVIIIAVLHGLSGSLFLRLFERYFGSGTVFAVIYGLLPLGCEGTHWLSASTRIVLGLFFCAVAANIFDDYILKGGIYRIPLFFLAALASYGLYEQILALSVTFTALQALKYRKERRTLLALAVPAALAVYFIFTGFNASEGSVGARMQLALPINVWYFKAFLPELIRQMGAVFIKGGVLTAGLGFIRGLELSVWGIVYTLFAAGVGVGVCFASLKLSRARKEKIGLPVILWCVLLTLAPLSPYFIIANPYFTFRAAVPTFVGLALMADVLIGKFIGTGKLYSLTSGLLAAVFLVAGASEVRDYRAVGEYDDSVARIILSYSDELSGRIGILGLEERPPTETNFYFGGHIVSCCASDWSLYGKITSLLDEPPEFYPVPLGLNEYPFYRGWNSEVKRISGFDEIWYFDNDAMTMTKVSYVKDGENDYLFFFPDGTYMGRIYEEDGFGYADFPEI